MLLTVRKEGPNTGRQFYKCPKPQGGGSCDFFLWADASTSGGNSSAPAQPAFGGGRGHESNSRQPPPFRNQPRDDSSEICCDCGDPARQLTVQKEGPNQGKQFYACAKPIDTKCRFFQWGDEAGGGFGRGDSNARFGGGARYDGGGGSRGRGRGRGGRGKSNDSSESRKARKCGSCGQEGIY